MTSATSGSDQSASPASGSSSGSSAAAPVAALKLVTDRWMAGPAVNVPTPTALNQQILQAVQTTNSETAAYAATQVAVAPNMMISQASGLIAQSAASYFDSVSKLGLAAQSVLLKQMTENIAKKDMQGAADDAIGALLTDMLVGAAAAVAAAAGAVDATAATTAINTIDQSISKTKSMVGS